jgi:hypothetical protein
LALTGQLAWRAFSRPSRIKSSPERELVAVVVARLQDVLDGDLGFDRSLRAPVLSLLVGQKLSTLTNWENAQDLVVLIGLIESGQLGLGEPTVYPVPNHAQRDLLRHGGSTRPVPRGVIKRRRSRPSAAAADHANLPEVSHAPGGVRY